MKFEESTKTEKSIKKVLDIMEIEYHSQNKYMVKKKKLKLMVSN